MSRLMENLEGRRLMAATISGSVMRDLTGNGLTADDTALQGVTVKLHKDLNGNGILEASDGASIASKVTGVDGKFSFGNLAQGKYLLADAAPSTQIRTAPLLSSNIAVNVTQKNATYGNNVFANYVKDFNKADISNISYTINRNGSSFTVTTLAGNVKENDIVTANFTVKAGKTVTMSFVSYQNPLNVNNNEGLLKQTVYNYQTKTFTGGKGQLTVVIPDCYFQMDLVGGYVIDKFGPAGSNIMYTPQSRLVAAALGGENACDCGGDDHEMGRMTGGGSVFLGNNAIGGPAGTRVTHGFQLHCAQVSIKGGPIEDVNNRLEINWNQSKFHLSELTFVECFDTAIVQAPPKSAPIDTLHGIGNGRFSGTFNGKSYFQADAKIDFTLTDGGPTKGEPGINDTSNYRIIVLDGNLDGIANDPIVVLDTKGALKLDHGNHQAHKEITPLTRNVDLVM